MYRFGSEHSLAIAQAHLRRRPQHCVPYPQAGELEALTFARNVESCGRHDQGSKQSPSKNLGYVATGGGGSRWKYASRGETVRHKDPASANGETRPTKPPVKKLHPEARPCLSGTRLKQTEPVKFLSYDGVAFAGGVFQFGAVFDGHVASRIIDKTCLVEHSGG